MCWLAVLMPVQQHVLFFRRRYVRGMNDKYHNGPLLHYSTSEMNCNSVADGTQTPQQRLERMQEQVGSATHTCLLARRNSSSMSLSYARMAWMNLSASLLLAKVKLALFTTLSK
jgi:hypothetical protein